MDLGARPCVRDDVVLVDLGEQGLVYDLRSGSAHVLNATATALWPMFDGHVALRDLARDVAEVYGASRDAVGDQLVGLAKSLGRLGLLVGIAGTARPRDPSENGC